MTINRFLIQDSIDTVRVIATAGIGVARAAEIAEDLIAVHNEDTTNVHGIADTSLLAIAADVASALAAHAADTTAIHGIANTALLETTAGAQAKVDTLDAELTAAIAAGDTATAGTAASALAAHEADTTAIHGIANTALLETTDGAQAKVDTLEASLPAEYAPLPTGTPTVGQVPVVTDDSPLTLGWGDGGPFIAYIGTFAAPVDDPDEARPAVAGPVYWSMADGVDPNNAEDFDIVVHVDGSNVVISDGSVQEFIALTQAEYDALDTPRPTSTIYVITDA